MRRINKVLEVGCGIGAQKAIATAIKHPGVEIHAVERIAGNEHEIFLKRFGKMNLPNLKIKKGQSAMTYLRNIQEKEKRPIFDHAYAHWVLSVMNRQSRLDLFREVMKNIKPGAKWAIVDEGFIEEQVANELRETGFRVSVRRISLDELIKNPPLNIEEVSRSDPMRLMRIGSGTLANYGNIKRFIQDYELLKRTKGEGAALKLIKTDRQVTRKRLEGYAQGKPFGKDADAIRRMVMRRGSDLQRPFVVMTATKPRS